MTELLPPQRDLPPGHLEVRRRMLLAETARKPKAVRGRVVVLAAGVASALVAAAALAVALDRQTTTTKEAEAPYLLAVIQSPEWAVHNTTNPFCEGDEEEIFGCGGFVNVPEEASRSISQPPSTFSETTEITGGTKSRRRLLRSIVRSTRPSSITKIELESAPRLVRLRMTALDDSSYTRWQEGLDRERVPRPAARGRARGRGRARARERGAVGSASRRPGHASRRGEEHRRGCAPALRGSCRRERRDAWDADDPQALRRRRRGDDRECGSGRVPLPVDA